MEVHYQKETHHQPSSSDRSFCRKKVNVHKKHKTRYVANCYHHRQDGEVVSKFTPSALMQRYEGNYQDGFDGLPEHVDWEGFKTILTKLCNPSTDKIEFLTNHPLFTLQNNPTVVGLLAEKANEIDLSNDDLIIHCIAMIPLSKHDKIVSPAWNGLYFLYPPTDATTSDRESPIYFFHAATASGVPSMIYPGYEMGVPVSGLCGIMFSPLSNVENLYNWTFDCDGDGWVNGFHISVQSPLEAPILDIRIELQPITERFIMSYVDLGLMNRVVPNDIFEKLQKGAYMFEIAKEKMKDEQWSDGAIFDFIEMDDDEISPSLKDHILGSIMDDFVAPTLVWDQQPISE